MVLSIGELLIDSFQDENSITNVPGGAPFNVACNICSLGGEAAFFGAVGNDEFGNALKQYAERKISKSYIKTILGKDTTVASVSLLNGERSFRFIRDNGADYFLEYSDLSTISENNTHIVHFGSLMLSERAGINFIQSAINLYKEKNVLLSFDVNYRDDIYSSPEAAKQITKLIMKEMDIIKISLDELNILSSKKNVIDALKELFSDNQMVFLSLGKDGSLFYHNGKTITASSIDVNPVDTTGAGDAFYSYILYKLDRNSALLDSDKEIKQMLKEANVAGALSTLKKGATDVMPSLSQIHLEAAKID